MFDWHRNPSAGVRDTLKRQKPNTKVEFDERVKQVSMEFAEQVLVIM
jgi:translation initiation factor 5B